MVSTCYLDDDDEEHGPPPHRVIDRLIVEM